MKKRLLCLLLCFVFVLGMLAGCSQKTDEEAIDDKTEEASKSAITLGMYLLSEKEVSAAQAQKIEDAVNEITKEQFKIQLELHFYTEDKYYTELEKNFQKMTTVQDEREDEETSVETDENGDEVTTEEETMLNELGQVVLKYPTISDYQVDIFYFSGYDRYTEYYNKNYLSRLEDEVLQDVRPSINSLYLDSLKALNKKRAYAIPTNGKIGEYTYLLVNKTVMNQMHKAASDFTSLTCSEVQDLLAYTNQHYRDTYIPLYSESDLLDFHNFQYWGLDENNKLSNDFSLLGGAINDSLIYMEEGSYVPAGSVLQNSNFTDGVKVMKSYEFNGYFGTDAELKSDKKFAVGYVKGGAELVEEYGDEYEMIVLAKPQLTTADLYGNMFGIFGTCMNSTRAMDILTYMNTNVAFRNLLLYGIEGENYEMVDSEYEDEEGVPYQVVRRLNNDYIMDVNKTGNTLLAYTLEGNNPLMNEYAKKQNLDAVPCLYLGFDLSYNNLKLDTTGAKNLREYSAQVYDEIMACKTPEELNSYLINMTNRFSTDATLARLMQSAGSNNGGTSKACSVAYIYYQWLNANKIYKG